MIIQRKLSSWAQFVSEIDILCAGQLDVGDYVFRGHGQSSYKLVSSFDRAVNDTLRERNKKFKANIDSFKVRCRSNGIQLNTEEEAISLAQHYGLPTRALDWSYSPYVAAFFAISSYLNSSRKENPVIYILNKKEFLEKVDVDEVAIFDQWHHVNDRMRSQRGLLTLMRTDVVDLSSFLHSKLLSSLISTLHIEKTIVPDAIKHLSLMDISYERLFTGIGGMAQQIWFEFLSR